MKKLVLLLLLISLFSTLTVVPQTLERIRIGVFVDLTGQTSSFGNATRNGIILAADEINASGGIGGRKVELIIEDNQGREEVAKMVVKKLIEKDRVHAIIGDVASSNTLAAAPVAQEARIPLLTPASTHPLVTAVGDYIFRACFFDPFQGEAMARFAFNDLKARRVAILGDVNSDYSKGLSEKFTETFTKLGGKIVVNESYTQNDPDFKTQLVKMRRQKPDAIYVPGYYGQAGVIAKQTRELGMAMPILGGDGWDSPELWKLGGDALENTYITNHFADDLQAIEVKEFVRKYKAEYGTIPDSLAALAYDSARLLADAIRRAKSTGGANIRNALAQTTNFSGVTGKISGFTPARNPIKSAVVLKLNTKTNRFVFQRTIAP